MKKASGCGLQLRSGHREAERHLEQYNLLLTF